MSDLFSDLPAHLADRMRATVAKREAAGTNVHFVNDSGVNDRFSFATAERAEAYRAKLVRTGRKVL